MINVGIDGCPGGWVAAIFDNSKFFWRKASKLSDLNSLLGTAELTLIDMPIGLLANYKMGGRVCDQLARRLLPKNKKSSVFSAPPRSILTQTNYENCRNILQQESGGISLQSFYLLPKIRELDELIRANRNLKILEAHPELVFQHFGLVDAPNKKNKQGRLARLMLLEEQDCNFIWPPPKSFPQEDCLDALALAVRAFQGNLKTVDPNAVIDPQGISMQIHY